MILTRKIYMIKEGKFDDGHKTFIILIACLHTTTT